MAGRGEYPAHQCWPRGPGEPGPIEVRAGRPIVADDMVDDPPPLLGEATGMGELTLHALRALELLGPARIDRGAQGWRAKV